ncbi:MAG TPA: substrate-binding domain-containing protein [Opitutus sp.]|nr:substrate-binding domain-containing protein [Opitutus sp.]
MARPRSAHTLLIKSKLIARLRDGFQPPGQKFFSNRALAKHFGVSYQTAHRLIQELEAEGWLERRAAAGTYVAGHSVRLKGVELFFHERARRKGSFGERLLTGLREALSDAGLPSRLTWSADGERPFPQENWLPILWECPRILATLAAQRRFGVVLNDRPPPGLASSYVDSVATDDFSGGVAAAELLRTVAPPRELAVLAGPKNDRRSQRRVEGFQSHAPKSAVFWADSWFEEDAVRVARSIAGRNFSGVFCCNDRLAQAFLATGASAAVVGFDDAPIAEQLNLTTIAVPWTEITESAVDIARRRIGGAVGAAAQLIFAPRSVVRATLK